MIVIKTEGLIKVLDLCQGLFFLVSLSGMAKTPRLQAKQIFHCRGATCHSGESRNPGKMELRILDAPGLQIAGAGLSVIPDLIRDRHDAIVDLN